MVNHVLTLILNKRKQSGEYFIDPLFYPVHVPGGVKPLEAIINTHLKGRRTEEQAYYINAFLTAPDVRPFLVHRDDRLVDVLPKPGFFNPDRSDLWGSVVAWANANPFLFDHFTGRDSRLSGLRSLFDVSFDPAVRMAAALMAYAYRLERGAYE